MPMTLLADDLTFSISIYSTKISTAEIQDDDIHNNINNNNKKSSFTALQGRNFEGTGCRSVLGDSQMLYHIYSK